MTLTECSKGWWLAGCCLLLAANTGCHLIHPPRVPPPLDPLPEVYHHEPTGELPPNVQDKMEDMELRVRTLTRQMDQLQAEVDERQHDLVSTRQQYDEALREIQLMREEITFWGSFMQTFQRRLSERDEERLEMLDQLSRQLGDLAVSGGLSVSP